MTQHYSLVGTDPEIVADIDRFESTLADYLDGKVDEDVFRVFRLSQGIYGQRQGGHNQMVRAKVPYTPSSPTNSTCSATWSTRTREAGDTSRPARTCSSTSCNSSRFPTFCEHSVRWA